MISAVSCKSKQGFLILDVGGGSIALSLIALRLQCASDVPLYSLHTPFTICCTLATSNSCHILLACFSTCLSHDSRNNCVDTLNSILSSTYAVYPLHENNVFCHYVFENWPVLDKGGCSAFTLLHPALCASCPLIYTEEPFASNICTL